MAAPHADRRRRAAALGAAGPERRRDPRAAHLDAPAGEPHMGKLPNNDYGAGIVDAYAAITPRASPGRCAASCAARAVPLAARVAVPALGIETTSDPATGAYELTRAGGHAATVEVSPYGYRAASRRDLDRRRGGARPRLHARPRAASTRSPAPSPAARRRRSRARASASPARRSRRAYTGAEGAFSLEVADGRVHGQRRGDRPTSGATRQVDGRRRRDGRRSRSSRSPPRSRPAGASTRTTPTRTGLSGEELAARRR